MNLNRWILGSAAVLGALLLAACAQATGSSSTSSGSTTSTARSAAVSLTLAQAPAAETRGHWGIHAWVMKGTTYIDTLTFYDKYASYNDAKTAAQGWLNDGGTAEDGISSATVYTDTSTADVKLSWDGENYNGTAVPNGTYQIKVLVTRHATVSPFYTLYTANVTVGSSASTVSLALDDTSLDATVFPYNVLTAGSVTFQP